MSNLDCTGITAIEWHSWLIWSAVATVVLTVLEASAQGLRLTRMSLPFLLGTMVTPNRDRARLWGFLMHLVNGEVIALGYLAVFQVSGGGTWMRGALLGLLNALFVLLTVMPLAPALHPRMASEERGPTATRQLEPPGLLGLHYGYGTPVVLLLSHALFGALLGAFYRPIPGC